MSHILVTEFAATITEPQAIVGYQTNQLRKQGVHMGQASSDQLETATHRVAHMALFRSALISMVAPSIIYRLAEPHFPAGSLWALGLSGLPPAIALAYSVFKLKAIDFLGLFAAENVVVDMMALVLAHSEKGALIGRAFENPILALFFLGSLMLGQPLVLSMSRQLSTGNDPRKRASFDAVASQPHAMRVYRFMTWVWVFALFIKAGGSLLIAEFAVTKSYLFLNPIWSIVSDAILVTWTMLYGRAKLVSPEGPASGGIAGGQLNRSIS
ncbi:VC0807 family protein [Paraburkholderia pallida]|uniref:Intracellular septation protein A n=1 Tax=Paraburkholderia pallida TaxID=2547399 RepID=A0A4P7D426_9BURK|nr:VC0807 family protein [Paraburkholderia pallida]QBR03419.1 hypothetical protein E1956_40545 [Paraburkholderia pallida]